VLATTLAPEGGAMGLHWRDLPDGVLGALHEGAVIPAHPLALDARRALDLRRQRALSRYYVDAGVSGLAVGVHTTQFAIRDAGFYEPVLRCGAETGSDWTDRPIIMIAGLVGRTEQALREADIARGLGYHAGLLSLAALKGASEDELISHCARIAEEIPLVGFYLQPAVGGFVLSANFWRRFAAIDNVIAIKIAPFNRYRTLDVIRGVVEARAEQRITLLTGNDDHIVLDLLCPYTLRRGEEQVTIRITGGLLGHWCVWTKKAVELVGRICRNLAEGAIDPGLLALDAAVTDCNAAFFDAANAFSGCIAGCHEVLRRQGLLEGTWCLDPNERLSPGQAEQIDRVYAAYPDLNDDAFVAKNLHRWLS
jgi:Dihydrodipicolinate synthetase family